MRAAGQRSAPCVVDFLVGDLRRAGVDAPRFAEPARGRLCHKLKIHYTTFGVAKRNAAMNTIWHIDAGNGARASFRGRS
jgi:hypothetical protein